MKVILFMTMSLNGIVARDDYNEDFISDNNWESFVNLATATGCIVWGRVTQEQVDKWDEESLKQIEKFFKIVVSSQTNLSFKGGYLHASNPEDAISIASKMGFEKIMLVGGSGLNTSFAKENLIDEVIINIEPTVIGSGIPIFAKDSFDLTLELIDVKKISNSIVQLHYKVVK